MAQQSVFQKFPKKPSGEVQLYFIDVTPPPLFTGLEGSHNGMFGLMEVLGCMLVFGRITATDVAANKAEAKMYPPVAHLQALFAALRVRLDILDLIEVCAFRHNSSQRWI